MVISRVIYRYFEAGDMYAHEELSGFVKSISYYRENKESNDCLLAWDLFTLV